MVSKNSPTLIPVFVSAVVVVIGASSFALSLLVYTSSVVMVFTSVWHGSRNLATELTTHLALSCQGAGWTSE